MASEVVSGSKHALREIAPDLVDRGTHASDQIISGTQVISGSSSAPTEEAPPSLIRLEIPHGEGLGVYIAIAWSLMAEAGVAAIGYAIWQIWKVF